jgi:acyl-CoA-binding protein
MSTLEFDVACARADSLFELMETEVRARAFALKQQAMYGDGSVDEHGSAWPEWERLRGMTRQDAAQAFTKLVIDFARKSRETDN